MGFDYTLLMERFEEFINQDLTITQINAICTLLDIPAEHIEKYFFKKKS